eukprot:g13544.t1 g13544   contig8:914181-916401(-)
MGWSKILVSVAFASAAFSVSEVWDVLLENANSDTDAGGNGISITNAVNIALSVFAYDEEVRSTILQSFVEPFIIVAILLLNACVGVWQDLSARSSLEALKKMQPRLATVLRYDEDTNNNYSDWITDYDATQLVPGDIIRLRVGEYIPADARLASLTSSTMYVDESSLTGESVSVGKLPGDEGLPAGDDKKTIPIQDQSSMLFSGSLVTRGSGTALVVRTGTSTQMGKIQSTLAEAQSETDERKTPLGEQLDQFGTTLSHVIGGICLAVWIASVPRFSDSAFSTWLEGAIYYAKVGVALGVAAIPEGLPAVITLCLSLGTRRMAERNVIVRKLPSVETLGCTSVICTDKTGTLTSNQMTSVSLVLLETTENGIELVEHEITGSSYNPFGSAVGIDRSETVRLPNGAVKDACDIMTLCNDARLIGNDVLADNTEKKNSSGGSTTQQYSIEGEPTEAALLVLVEKLGSISADADESPSTAASLNNQLFSSRYERYATLEFDSKRKSMSVLCSSTVDNQNKLFVKGAPSMLLRRCSHAKLRDGKVVPLTPQLRSQIEDEISSIGDRALRCIGLAFKDDSLVPQLQNENHQYNDYLKDSSIFEVIESDLVFVGITAIRDPPRDGVAESIDLCKQAGIRVVMITGDSKSTSVAIAKDVHIFKGES